MLLPGLGLMMIMMMMVVTTFMMIMITAMIMMMKEGGGDDDDDDDDDDVDNVYGSDAQSYVRCGSDVDAHGEFHDHSLQ